MKREIRPPILNCPTASRLLVITCVTVFFSELFIMLLLSILELRIPALIRAFLDSFLLIAILLPMLYRFLYLPVFRCIHKIIEDQEELIMDKCRLELRRDQRTAELEQEIEKCSMELSIAREKLESRGRDGDS